MKREIINFVAVIGLVLLGGAAALGLVVGVLFIFPEASFFGAKAVNERDTQIVYYDNALYEALENGRLILESTGTQIEVKMSKADYEGERTIVVNEAATGIAFNDLGRTLIEWTQTYYNNELYYRIKVLEPSGMVFNSHPTTVYINLPHRDLDDERQFHFVLQDKYSTVNFSMVDAGNQGDALKIGNLVVESAAGVTIAPHKNISINNLEIKSNHTEFTCQSAVLGNVTVTGSQNNIVFNAPISGNVTVKGDHNQFRGDQAGNVNYTSKNGGLSMNNVKKLTVDTVAANVSVGVAQSGVVMQTEQGALNVNKITGGGLDFTVATADKPFGTATVNVSNQLTGNVQIRNYGVGSINLNGVNGHVDIHSYQIQAGEINVAFQDQANGCQTKILGYDGNINVRGINGWVNIEIDGRWSKAGAANIKAQFNKVVNTQVDGKSNCIWSGGYVSGHDDWGNVEVTLANTCNNFDLFVYGSRSFRYKDQELENSDTNTGSKKGYEIRPSEKSEEGSSGTLEIHSQNKVQVR